MSPKVEPGAILLEEFDALDGNVELLLNSSCKSVVVADSFPNLSYLPVPNPLLMDLNMVE
jgi:hypothetical protein